MSKFAERLRHLRSERGLTQQDLADRLQLARPTVAGYEIGRREPDYVTLRRIAGALGVSIDYLLGRTDYPAPLPEGVESGPEADKELGHNLQAARQKIGMAIEDAARASGIPLALLQEYETGERPPEDAHLDALAAAYGVGMGFLLSGGQDVRAVALQDIAYLFPPDVQKWIVERKNREYIYLLKELGESGIPPESIRAIIYAIRSQFKDKSD